MDWLPFLVFAILIPGSLLGMLTTYLVRREPPSRDLVPGTAGQDTAPVDAQAGAKVLKYFAVVVVVFGLITAYVYRAEIWNLRNNLFLAFWLFVFMVGGMFVQVLNANYRKGEALLHIEAAQLLYPLLFSIIVFYPIWVIGSSEGATAFAFYASFLNGYFWESVVASARRPGDDNT